LRDELNGQRARSAAVVTANLLDLAALPGIVAGAVSAFGRLDALINNASSFYPTPLGSVSPEQWADLMGTNLRAPFFLAQAAAPQLRSTKGVIVNMIDIHAQRPLPRHPVYSTAKAGLAMMTRALARELAPDVRVNGIAPGPILWPGSRAAERDRREDTVEAQRLARGRRARRLVFRQGRAVRHWPDPGGRRWPERGMVTATSA
jgi:pteridine reductase